MLRNSVLYHRFWYVKKRNSKRAKMLMRLAAIIIILSALISYANDKTFPYLMEISQIKAEKMITEAMVKTVEGLFPKDMEYRDIVKLGKDKKGNVTSIETDMVKLNKLSGQISQGIHETLNQLQKDRISVPAGALLGITVLATSGPDIYIGVQPYGVADVDFKSEFTKEGINQTRHRIFLQVKTKVKLWVPLLNKESEVVANIPIAETVIVGKVEQASTFYSTTSSSMALFL
jgi:sporulation protein YunB